MTIIVATYGDASWERIADRAVASTAPFRNVTVVRHHEPVGDLADARNAAVDAADPSGWLCFLDADDELEAGFVPAMRRRRLTPRIVAAPAVRYAPSGPALTLAARDIATMNPCVVGSLIHRDMFDAVGGFWHERAWEDWSLFRRAWLLGARIVHVPDAVYRAHPSRSGRNSTVTNPHRLHADIVASHNAWLAARQVSA